MIHAMGIMVLRCTFLDSLKGASACELCTGHVSRIGY